MKVAHEPKDDRGRPYHVRVSKEDSARIAFLPGDPGRVPLIAKELEDAREVSTNREFTAFVGRAGGERVMVVSTGIGGPAAAIAVEELARQGVKVLIRVGSCGSITKKVKVGSVLIADAAVRLDGTSADYIDRGYPAAASPGVVMALEASARMQNKKVVTGVAASTDSFYVGQGRTGFGGYLPPHKEKLMEGLRDANVLCFEMEAATIFTLGRIFGLKTGAVLAVVGERETGEFREGAGVEDAIGVAVGSVKFFKQFGV